MALLFNNAIFFHIGRTAGYWVRDVIHTLSVTTRELAHLHATPGELNPAELEGRKTFTLIRHPLAWLKSFWLHEIMYGSTNADFLSVYSRRFDRFLENIAECVGSEPEGFVAKTLRPYIDNVQIIKRTEDLPRSLEDVLRSLDLSVTDEELARVPRTNMGALLDLGDYAYAPRRTLERLMESERGFWDQFGYTDVPAELIGSADGVSRIFLGSQAPVPVRPGKISSFPHYDRDDSPPSRGSMALCDFHHIAIASRHPVGK
jgi:hypothetical protein